MNIINSKSSKVRLPLAEAAEVMFDEAGRVAKKSEKFYFIYNGRPLVGYTQHDVRGSEQRDVSKQQFVYRDHVGRLTLETKGEPVGMLLKGGTNGRMSIVGFFNEVSDAKAH